MEKLYKILTLGCIKASGTAEMTSKTEITVRVKFNMVWFTILTSSRKEDISCIKYKIRAPSPGRNGTVEA